MTGLPAHFMARVSVDGGTGCWQWTGGLSEKGYGIYRLGRAYLRAHRYAYAAVAGAIPAGLQLDHLCRNRRCVNPAHLEPVTSRENTMRGENWAAAYARRTHCDNGHPFAGPNLRIRPGGGRVCRTCETRSRRERRARSRVSPGRPAVAASATG